MIRYEDIVATGGIALATAVPEARSLNAQLSDRNSKRPQGEDHDLLQHLSARLLSTDGPWWKFYDRENVTDLVSKFRSCLVHHSRPRPKRSGRSTDRSAVPGSRTSGRTPKFQHRVVIAFHAEGMSKGSQRAKVRQFEAGVRSKFPVEIERPGHDGETLFAEARCVVLSDIHVAVVDAARPEIPAEVARQAELILSSMWIRTENDHAMSIGPSGGSVSKPVERMSRAFLAVNSGYEASSLWASSIATSLRRNLCNSPGRGTR